MDVYILSWILWNLDTRILIRGHLSPQQMWGQRSYRGHFEVINLKLLGYA